MKSQSKIGQGKGKSGRTFNRRRALIEALEKRVFLSAVPTPIDLADLSSAIGSNSYGNLVMDTSGNLYGLAENGGANGVGSVFSIGAGGGAISTVASFNSTTGDQPESGPIIDSSGDLFGTTSNDGANGDGTVFEVLAGSNSITTLASFNDTAGKYPVGGLVVDSSGNLYGTTRRGGANNDGVVFELPDGGSTITDLADFNGPNGAVPFDGLAIDTSGNLYGTTFYGGANGNGNVFELAAGSSTITDLADFGSGLSGPNAGVVIDSSGNLYGTAPGGGANGDGGVFEVAVGSGTITDLADFNGTNGDTPNGGLIIDSAGNLYGTATNGGPSASNGTVFELAAGSSSITLLAAFNGTDGGQPNASLLMDSDGNLYGTTVNGGANGVGTVFEVLAPQAAIATQPSTITAGTSQSITVNLDSAGVVDPDAQSTVTLSIASGPGGATIGGTLSEDAVNGVATFSGLTFDTAGSYTVTASASGFASATTGTITVNPADASQLVFAQQPASAMSGQNIGAVVNVEDAFGNVVTSDNSTVALATVDGTPLQGTASVQAVDGVATFTGLSINPLGSYTLAASDASLTANSNSFTISALTTTITGLNEFNSTTGYTPSGNVVIDSSGNLWGAAENGGANSQGTVWEVPAGTTSITPIASFDGTDGSNPYGGVIMDSNGDLFGTTRSGGDFGVGTVFEIPSGATTITVVASFNGTNGSYPYDTLSIDSNGNLYGTTYYGGDNSDGTVFMIAAGGSTITTIASFNGTNGENPRGGVVMDSSDDLFGTTQIGGSSNDGTVFEIAAGTSDITTLVNFNGANGAYPEASLIIDSSGNLYGTTYTGNSWADVFEIAAETQTYSVLATMPQYTQLQAGSLLLDSDGNLFGTAYQGGANSNGNGYTEGAVFEIPAGSSTSITLGSFDQPTTGMFPLTNVVMDSSGDLFTTSSCYGASGNNTGDLVDVAALPAATQAAFITQPTTVTAGSTQSITVSIETSSGAILLDSASVALSIASGPTGATIGGALTAADTDGVASFSGLTFDKAGTYTLMASGGGVTGTSATITVTSASASQLAFVQQPVSLQQFHTTPSLQVAVEDQYGNIVTADTSTVSLSTTTPISGTYSVAAVAGVATFDDAWIATAGNYTLTAGDGSLNSATSNSIPVLPPGYTLSELVDFATASTDDTPAGNLIADSNGNLFGAADMGGGIDNDGAVFEIPAGTTTVVNLAVFDETTGNNPAAGVVMDSNGDLFGTTFLGGNDNDGTVYEVAAGSSSITTLVLFNQTTGYVSDSQLLMDSSGNLFGTTYYGGAYNDGTLFEIAAGTTSLAVIASFNQSTGFLSDGNLIMDSSGNLYGAAVNGGANNDGTVFEVAAGSSTVTDLADFTSASGATPTSGVVMDSSGNLYGADEYGGANDDGTLFELAVGSNTIMPLASFSSDTGYDNLGSLTMDSDGHLFGTTEFGGANGDGTVFVYSGGAISALGSLSAAVGANPDSGILIDSSGNLYGTAELGGTDNGGTIFEASPSSSTQAAITAQPTTVTAGAAQSISVSLESLDGTVDTTNQSPVTLTIDSGPTGGSIGGTLTVSAVNGVADFTGLTLDIAGTYTITASSPGVASASTSTITVNAAMASQLAVVQQPSSVQAGQSLGTVIVDVEDTFGNLVTTDTSTVTLSTSTSLGGTTSVAAIGGVGSFTDLSVDLVGSYTLSADDGMLASATSNSFTITPGAAAQLAFDQQPGSATAGQTIGTITVDVEDSYGNIVTSDDSLVSLSTSVPIYGTDGMQAVSGVATLSGLSIQTAGAYTLTASDGSLTTATSNSITITAADAAQLAFSQQPVSAIAGQSIGTVTVDVEDTYGNLVTTDSSSVTLSAGPTINGTTTEQAAGGVATFTGLSIDEAIALRLSAGDGSLNSALSSSFTISPADASQLVIHQQPTGAAAGQTIGTFVLYVEDTYGNVVTTDTSTATVSTSVPIFGTTSVNAAGGVVSFSDFWIDPAGSYTLTVADGDLTSATSNSITITPADASKVVFDSQPASATAGQSIGTVTADVEDLYGNLVTSDTSSVSLSTSTAINGTTSKAAVGGVATFAGLSIDLAGGYTLSASDGSLTSATSNSFTINPGNASQLAFDQQPTTTTAGQTMGTVTVDVEDAFGNLVTTDTSTVSLSTSAAINGTTSKAAVGGVATFAGLSIDLAGGYTLSSSDGNLTSATSNSFTINPAIAAQLVFDQQPGATIVAGQSIGTVSVDVEDVYGNLVTTDTSTVTLATGDASPLIGTASAAAVGGVATFTGLADTLVGTHSLSATDGSLTPATSTSFAITPAAASQLVFAQQPGDAIAAQTLAPVIVDVEDAFGNLVTTDSSMVTLSTTTTLGGTASVQAAGGVATFSSLSIGLAGTYALTASDSSLNATSTSFAILPAYELTDVADFGGSTTAAFPDAGLVMDSVGNLYGTTAYGGVDNDGTVFEVAAGSDTITTLASFNGIDGSSPQAGLVMDSSGNLYGTAHDGGANSQGAVFELAAGSSTITSLGSFNGTNGGYPQAGLVMDSSGNLYGTTYTDGAAIGGTVFEVAAGASTITLLASFTTGTGTNPLGAMVMDSSGNLYGTTYQGGAHGFGTIFEVPANSATIVPLASLTSATGEFPVAGLAIDSSGNLFGTTLSGGANSDGTVFELAAGSSTITPLVSFNSTTGTEPDSALVVDSSGDLFGTTTGGGANSSGTAFEIPAGTTSIFPLASFSAATGANPQGSLIIDSHGNVYGTAEDGGAFGSGDIFVLSPAPTQVVITNQPTTVTAGAPQSISVALETTGGQVSIDDSSVTLSIADGPTGATVGGTLTVSAVDGIATFSGLTFDTAGTYQLSASADGLPLATTSTITVNPAAAAALAIVQQPGNATAGQGIGTVTVDVEDAYGNLVTTDNSTVALATVDGTPIGGTTSVQASGGVASFTGFSIVRAGDYSLSITDGALTPATSSSFMITPAAASQLAFAQQPGDANAGQTLGTVAVDVEDAYGNLVTTDTSTVTLATVGGTPIGGTPSVSAIGGVASFTGLSINLAGSYLLSATDEALTPATSDLFTIAAAAASQLVFAQQPTNATAGQTFGPVTVDVEDAYGNLVTTDSSTVMLATVDGTPLSGTNSISAVGGVATFNGLSLTAAGAHSLSATDGALASATSGSFAVSAAAAAKLVVVQQPTNATSGQTIGTVSVEVEDAYGNLVVGSPSNVTLAAQSTGSSTTGTLLTGTTTVTTQNGVAVFSNLMITTGGTFTLSATDGGLAGATSAPITVAAVTPSQVETAGTQAAPLMIDTSTAFPSSDGQSKRLKVRIENQSAGGKIVENMTIAVKNGRAMINHINLHTAGIYNVVITDAAGHTITEQISVLAAVPKRLAFIPEPAAVNGQSPITVCVVDQFGNVCTSANGAIVALHLSPTSAFGPGATLNGTVTATVVNGVATFTDVIVERNGHGQLIATTPHLQKAVSTVVKNGSGKARRRHG